MPFAILGWPLAKWAAFKALGWAGLGRWLAHRTTGALTGSTAWALLVVAVLIGGLVLWRWSDPPERTYTEAEVRADRQQQIIQVMQRAAEDKDRIIAERGRALAALEDNNRGLADENEKLRRGVTPASGAAFTDDDPWLQRKRARSGQAGARPGSR